MECRTHTRLLTLILGALISLSILLFATTARASVQGEGSGDPMSYPASAIGMIMEETAEGDFYNCTGSVVTTPGRPTVVMTAAHCVVDELTGKPMRMIYFMPGYKNGATPYGVWTADPKSYVVDPEFDPRAGREERSGDVAFFTLRPRKGKSLKSVTGSIGIGFGESLEQTYTDWAYPKLAPYDGEDLMHITGGLVGQSEEGEWTVPTLGIASDFTPGASGGPWTIGPKSAPVAVSLNSYVNYGHDGLIWGPQFDSRIEAVFESAGGDPANAGPVRAPRLHLKLWAHARDHGRRTAVTFGVKGGEGIGIGYRCRTGGRVHGCQSGLTVPAGEMVHVEAFYDAPAYRRVIGSLTVATKG